MGMFSGEVRRGTDCLVVEQICLLNGAKFDKKPKRPWYERSGTCMLLHEKHRRHHAILGVHSIPRAKRVL